MKKINYHNILQTIVLANALLTHQVLADPQPDIMIGGEYDRMPAFNKFSIFIPCLLRTV